MPRTPLAARQGDVSWFHAGGSGAAAPKCRRSASAAWACPNSTAAGDEAESIATIHRAIDAGVNFLDTADMYGVGRNEELVGRAIADRRDGVVLATKFGNVRGRGRQLQGRRRAARLCAVGLRRQPEAARGRRHRPLLPAPGRSRRRHRGDGRGDGRAGRGREGALSSASREAAPATIRRAHAVHPIAALQTEYSLWSRDAGGRDPADGARARHRLRAPTARSAAASSPASSRAPTTSRTTITAASARASRARTSRRTSIWSREIEAMAREKGCTPAQLASPGCWRRGRTSCRSRARSGVGISRRISVRSK